MHVPVEAVIVDELFDALSVADLLVEVLVSQIEEVRLRARQSDWTHFYQTQIMVVVQYLKKKRYF